MFHTIKSVLIAATLAYPILSFVAWDWDLTAWHWFVRLLYVWCLALAYIFGDNLDAGAKPNPDFADASDELLERSLRQFAAEQKKSPGRDAEKNGTAPAYPN